MERGTRIVQSAPGVVPGFPMQPTVETCWTLIQAAAEGGSAEREEFARRYQPIVRQILGARWRGTSLAASVDDATQEVFLTCFREGGLLGRADGVTRGFRAFLYGATRNVARQFERRRLRRDARFRLVEAPEAVSFDSGLQRLFDREYARSIVREAVETMRSRAEVLGEGARRRVRLLERRFEDGLRIREISRLWNEDGRGLHLEQAKAVRELRSALRQVVGLSERCAPERVDRTCKELLGLLE